MQRLIELADKNIAIAVGDIKIDGVEFLQLVNVEIHHAANSYARAKIVCIVDENKAKTFIEQANADKVKISAKVDKKDTVLFQGYISNVMLETRIETAFLTVDLLDAAWLLDWKKETCSFQKLTDKFEDVLKTAVKDSGGKINLKVTDKAIEKTILRLNETSWEFIKRLAAQFNAAVFTDITAEKPLLTIGLPEPKNSVEIEYAQVSYTFDDAQFQFFNANAALLAEGSKIVAEDFFAANISEQFQYLNLADSVKIDKKEYFVKEKHAKIFKGVLVMSYKLAGKTAFFVPIEIQKNIYGRIFRAQVKKVEKDKIQAHLIDVDEKYDSSGTAWFPFATVYSSGDGSGWYVMPEVDDYVRILFPSIDTADAFASSSINTAPLKEPKNKSLKAPGGREILLTDKGVEIIAEHQKTFIQLDKGKGINIVSSKDINILADGNISFEAKGKIQMVSQKEITAQSGQSHMKILANQIDMGGSNIIVGE